MDTTNSNKGPIIAVVVIAALIVVGAVYFWSGRSSSDSASTVSASDDIGSIESDLQASGAGPDLSDLDTI
ncbi:hypothetical protein KW799_01915 [Candidatus Parcubacteria bacterium]|nr:hypothetical protein [Candidatus Parcubacteria bacterium]